MLYIQFIKSGGGGGGGGGGAEGWGVLDFSPMRACKLLQIVLHNFKIGGASI